MRIAIGILTFFGMIWGVAALLFAGFGGALLALAPVAAALVLLVSLKALPANVIAAEQMARNRKLVRRWSVLEGVAIVAAVFILARTGNKRHIPSAFAVIVGLHFLPLAIGFPQPVFYGTAAVMVVAGIVSTAFPSAQLQGEIAASAATIALWASALALMLFYRRSSTATV